MVTNLMGFKDNHHTPTYEKTVIFLLCVIIFLLALQVAGVK